VRTHFADNTRQKSQRLADLKNKTVELERKLSETRVSLERELAHFAPSRQAAPGLAQEARRYALEEMDYEHDAGRMSASYATPKPADGHRRAYSGDQVRSAGGRTEILVNHGRRSAYYQSLSHRRKIAIGSASVAALVVVLLIIISTGGASWPSSVAIVQSEAAKACQNPNVGSEPGQVNFACAKDTRQILWVFALITSADNPSFADTKTGRRGLEPITPLQGGELAWSLNLHHPYNPFNPVDSIEVAARAINNIIGGATLTGANGSPIVQSGLEGESANCIRYTGSAAVTSRKGFPSVCTRPVASAAGQAALVADVYRRWVVGAAPKAAQDAAVLFENSTNPGDPRVQAILRQLSTSKPLA
jgi:hypothetical protein